MIIIIVILPCNNIDDIVVKNINVACNSRPPGNVNDSRTGNRLLFVNVIPYYSYSYSIISISSR